MKYNNVGLVIGRKCTASCEMCCYSSNIERTEMLDPDIVKWYINSAKDLSFIKTIGFTGGEAFLYYDYLKEYIKSVKLIDKNATVMTNGFWAADASEAKEKILELKEAGLSAIGISYDEFHAKYIPAQNIINILTECRLADIPVKIQGCMLADSNTGDWLSNLGSHIIGQEIRFFPCSPVGAAKENISDDKFARRYPVMNQICSKGSVFSIKHDGTIYPCCNPLANNTELKLGNIYNKGMDIAATLEAIRSNNILYILRNLGFNFFVEVARTELSINLPEYIINACELCSIFFCKENIYKFIPYVRKKIKELKEEKLAKV